MLHEGSNPQILTRKIIFFAFSSKYSLKNIKNYFFYHENFHCPVISQCPVISHNKFTRNNHHNLASFAFMLSCHFLILPRRHGKSLLLIHSLIANFISLLLPPPPLLPFHIDISLMSSEIR